MIAIEDVESTLRRLSEPAQRQILSYIEAVVIAEEAMKERPPCRFSWVGALENEDIGNSSVDIQHKTVSHWINVIGE
ncbi:hypothetical protein [Methanospirillum hungatei]|uniref:hypothetical protein n=1 Tax=Methanospirillum hungatei TaxID=2203 RepID=UPI0026EDA737|nr:hypothetical protein [Methanospirillum hungatei]MCA1916817.1 hypothetical protein [Methanospirillum hungatei]